MFVVEENPAHPFGFSYFKLKVHNHPRVVKDGDIDGMYLLKKLPEGRSTFIPQPFVSGSRQEVSLFTSMGAFETNRLTLAGKFG